MSQAVKRTFRARKIAIVCNMPEENMAVILEAVGYK